VYLPDREGVILPGEVKSFRCVLQAHWGGGLGV
jgi:hypothetical protein